MPSDFIDDYHTYASPLEVPHIFHLWCALSALAAAAQRKVWIQRGHFVIAPNLYIVLDAEPGLGKDTAMNIVRDSLLDKVKGIPVKSDSITKEMIFRTMRDEAKVFTPKVGKPFWHSSLTVFASELSLLIKHRDRDFVEALKVLFNNSGTARNSTKGRGEDILVNPYLNLLAGTTPDWIARNMEEDLLEGGITARTIFVSAKQKSRINPSPQIGPNEELALTRMLGHLEQLAIVGGEFALAEGTKMMYEKWYNDYYDLAKPKPSPKMRGYQERKKIFVLKLGMLCSLSRGFSFVVEEGDFIRALKILGLTEGAMEEALSSIGRNVLAPIADSISRQIQMAKKVKIQDLYTSNYANCNAQEFKEIVAMLQDQGMIELNTDMTTSPPTGWLVWKGR